MLQNFVDSLEAEETFTDPNDINNVRTDLFLFEQYRWLRKNKFEITQLSLKMLMCKLFHFGI